MPTTVAEDIFQYDIPNSKLKRDGHVTVNCADVEDRSVFDQPAALLGLSTNGDSLFIRTIFDDGLDSGSELSVRISSMNIATGALKCMVLAHSFEDNILGLDWIDNQ